MIRRPNVLIVMTDQQRADHTGFGGNKVLRTPHLDSLAARGMVFDKAFVASPMCMPNRASILTGVMPSAHGVRINGLALDPSFETFVRVVREAGYATSLVGKAHFQNIGEDGEMVEHFLADAPRRSLWREMHEAHWDLGEDQQRHRLSDIAVGDFYGFDDVALTVNHSDYCSGHYYRWLIGKGANPEDIQGKDKAVSWEGNWQQVWKTSVPEELYPTSYIAEQTIRRIEEAARNDTPFLIQCSFPDPHHPFTPPGRYFDMYDERDIPLPATFDQDHAKSPRGFQAMIENRGMQFHKMAPFAPTVEQFRSMSAKEYGMIAMIDDAVGRILASLEASGMFDSTIIVFTSDHGDVFGDHGLMFKSAMHYEGAIRIPLVVVAPGQRAGRSRALVSSLDIGPTLLDLLGLGGVFGAQGKSLRPLLDDPSANIRDAVLIEEERVVPDLATGKPVNLRSVITDAGRLTLREYEPLDGELYDWRNDPAETENLFGNADASPLLAEMKDRLIEQMVAHSTLARRPRAMA